MSRYRKPKSEDREGTHLLSLPARSYRISLHWAFVSNRDVVAIFARVNAHLIMYVHKQDRSKPIFLQQCARVMRENLSVKVLAYEIAHIRRDAVIWAFHPDADWITTEVYFSEHEILEDIWSISVFNICKLFYGIHIYSFDGSAVQWQNLILRRRFAIFFNF